MSIVVLQNKLGFCKGEIALNLWGNLPQRENNFPSSALLRHFDRNAFDKSGESKP